MKITRGTGRPFNSGKPLVILGSKLQLPSIPKSEGTQPSAQVVKTPVDVTQVILDHYQDIANRSKNAQKMTPEQAKVSKETGKTPEQVREHNLRRASMIDPDAHSKALAEATLNRLKAHVRKLKEEDR